MNKRLLAGLMAFCLAAGAANAAFAEDPPLSGPLHTEIATSETAAPAEPTPVPPGPAEEDPAGENATGDELYTPTPSTTPATTATPESADPPDDEDEPAVQAVTLRSVKIQDNIKSTGELVAVVNGQSDPVDGVTYTWYRSKTGADGSWQQVTGQAVNGSDKNLTAEHPHALNAALDTLLARQSDPSAADTDRYHYKVDVASGSSTLQAEAQVNYYVQLQNGSFEYPVVSDGNFASDRFCYPNDHQRAHFLQTRDAETTSSIYWYTTTECNRWGDGVKGKFIEIADATTTVYTDTVITGWDRKGNAIKETYTDPNDVTQAYAIGKAYDGGQFAELNCQAYGALYQDVLTVPGATLNWSLAHAGRDGTDTMALLIAPMDVAQDITDALKNKTTRAAIQEALNGSITVNGVNVPIRNYIVDGNISDGCTAWGVHNGTYTVPAGQYVSRFFFVAVASASGDSEEGLKRGNLIDRVWFSTDPVPPAVGSGILRVTKTLLKTDGTALTDAELIQAKENLHFTVVNSDRQIVGDFSGSTMQADSINPNVLQYTLELPLTDSSGNTYNYAVTETARGEPTGYDCTLVRTVKDGGVWTDVTDTPIHSGIALTAQAATNIRFENTYARATGSLTITKQLPDDADDALQADFAETVNTFTIASVAAGSYTPQYSAGARPADAPAAVSPDASGRLTLSIKGAGSVTLPGLAPAGYTVTESAAPNLTNYYLTTPTANTVTVPFTFDSDDFTAPGDYIFSLTETAAGITGLTQDTAARYIVVRVVNTDPAAPDGSLEISEVNIVNADGTAKAGEITNTYAAYGLSVVKHLSGNFANAGDEFTFTIALDDPDEMPHASSVTVKTGGESADFSTITGDTVTFNADGTAEVKAGITGGEKIEVTGLPANTGYTITESGDTALSYTTTWDGITKTGSDDKTSDAQTMAAADKTITVTNSRTAPTPTGLLLDAAPYGAMLLAAGTGSVLLRRKRRNSDE